MKQNQEMLTIPDAVQRKYGVSAYAEDSRHYVGVGQTVAVNQQYQPWFGFALRHGKRKYWPAADVEQWATVWKYNRAQYAQELLQDERKEVREGVERQLRKLRDRGQLPQDVLAALEDHEALVGARA